MKADVKRIAPIALGILMASGAGAFAQEAASSPAGQTGIRAGAFMVYPEASITGSYNDNIYATPTNEVDDFVTTLAAQVAVNSTWSRHALNLSGGMSQDFFADRSDEDRFNWNIGADGQIDVTSTTALTGSLGYAQMHEDRGDANSIAAASEPIEYTVFSATAGISQEFNYVTVSLGGEYNDYDYDDATTTAGVLIDQDFRDYEQYVEKARIAYNISPDTNIYVEGQLDQREYDQQPPVVAVSRDSDGAQVVVGSEFMVTNLVEGGAYIGYQEREYDAAGFADTDGLAYGANIDWYITPLTTISFNADASVEETSLVTASGYDRQAFGVGVRHELLRTLVLDAGASYTNNDYNNDPREDDVLGLSAGLTYLVNPHFDIGLGYTYTDRDSNNAAFDYTRNVVGLTLTGKL